jgi:hypothetical protein
MLIAIKRFGNLSSLNPSNYGFLLKPAPPSCTALHCTALGHSPLSCFPPVHLSENWPWRTAPWSSFPPTHISESWPWGSALCCSFLPVHLSESSKGPKVFDTLFSSWHIFRGRVSTINCKLQEKCFNFLFPDRLRKSSLFSCWLQSKGLVTYLL